FADDVVAKLDAFVANEYRRARNQLAHLVLTLAAERAIKKLVAGRFIGHSTICSRNLRKNLSLLYAPMTRFCKTLSIKPYSMASSAHKKRSRSWSSSTCSGERPVNFAISEMKRRFKSIAYCAWRSISDTWPWKPPEGWWIRIVEFGSANRLPRVPAASRNAPIEAAMPMQRVETSGRMNCIVSKMAIP